MPTSPVQYNYYPALSNLISVEDLPEFLNFLKEQLQGVLDKIYYKNYYSSKNTIGSSAFYRLDIVPRTRLALDIFSSGFSLVLNPDHEDSTISSFPITLFWQWEIMRIVRNFNPSTFSYTPQAFFELAIDILGISKEQILESAVNTFVTPDNGLSSFEQLISDVGCSDIITIEENDYGALVEQIEASGRNVYLVIFDVFLQLINDTSATLQKLKDFFNPFFQRDFEAYIRELLIPKISASLDNISIALEFPRTWLKPINPATNEPYPEETRKSMLRFTVGALRISTANGFEFENENYLSFPKSQIGNTGLTISFTKIKLDLSTTSNITEATAAGYGDDFKGVFIQSAKIGLPKKWFSKSDSEEGTTLEIEGKNLLIGTGGFSGTIGLNASSPNLVNGTLWKKIGDNGFAIGFSSFDITFRQNTIRPY